MDSMKLFSTNFSEKGEKGNPSAQQISDLRKGRLCKPRKLTGQAKNRIYRYRTMYEWSPEQIEGRCKIKELPMVSKSTNYNFLYLDKNNGGKLYKKCRHKLKYRRRPIGKHCPIKDRVSLDERPKEADGTRFGDWEMDLIVDQHNQNAMVTLTEKKQTSL